MDDPVPCLITHTLSIKEAKPMLHDPDWGFLVLDAAQATVQFKTSCAENLHSNVPTDTQL